MINLRRKWYSSNKLPSDYGITYDRSVVQGMGEQTWYFNCKDVPAVLPDGYSILEGDIEKFIGRGLSEDDVKYLRVRQSGAKIDKLLSEALLYSRHRQCTELHEIVIQLSPITFDEVLNTYTNLPITANKFQLHGFSVIKNEYLQNDQFLISHIRDL